MKNTANRCCHDSKTQKSDISKLTRRVVMSPKHATSKRLVALGRSSSSSKKVIIRKVCHLLDLRRIFRFGYFPLETLAAQARDAVRCIDGDRAVGPGRTIEA
jgi:hypothetical protein